ncbi:hypothetical protein GCM10009541_14330 [Micromonospora gifhornensis]|uniref:Uncharacterized protein n=1 Tax=Micromonospora gifhornensis TaxID=84594 RepID=A0ABQ4IFH6_9ACTN|nr:hypothetical protein Vgi01_33620 [Micromonospora gifhornensis]
MLPVSNNPRPTPPCGPAHTQPHPAPSPLLIKRFASAVRRVADANLLINKEVGGSGGEEGFGEGGEEEGDLPFAGVEGA